MMRTAPRPLARPPRSSIRTHLLALFLMAAVGRASWGGSFWSQGASSRGHDREKHVACWTAAQLHYEKRSEGGDACAQACG